MSQISREDAIRIATAAIPPKYQSGHEIVGVSHMTAEKWLRDLPAIFLELSPADTSDLLSYCAAHPINPWWSVGLVIHSDDFRGGITFASVRVDEATGTTTLDLDTTKRRLLPDTD